MAKKELTPEQKSWFQARMERWKSYKANHGLVRGKCHRADLDVKGQRVYDAFWEAPENDPQIALFGREASSESVDDTNVKRTVGGSSIVITAPGRVFITSTDYKGSVERIDVTGLSRGAAQKVLHGATKRAAAPAPKTSAATDNSEMAIMRMEMAELKAMLRDSLRARIPVERPDVTLDAKLGRKMTGAEYVGRTNRAERRARSGKTVVRRDNVRGKNVRGPSRKGR